MQINYDLENSPLQIRTDSVVGSNERVAVSFFNAGGSLVGGINLYFTSPPQYEIRYCTTSKTNLPTDLPAEIDKNWTITLTRTSDVRLQIHCNDKEVLNVVMSDTTCSDSEWRKNWSMNVKAIKFSSKYDTASDFYRTGIYSIY